MYIYCELCVYVLRRYVRTILQYKVYSVQCRYTFILEYDRDLLQPQSYTSWSLQCQTVPKLAKLLMLYRSVMVCCKAMRMCKSQASRASTSKIHQLRTCTPLRRKMEQDVHSLY